MDFSSESQQQPVHQIQIPKYVFTGVIVGVLALFVGTMSFMYNIQQETDAARITSMSNTVYRPLTPSPTLQPIVILSAEEQLVEDILVNDADTDLSAVEQEISSL